ncbi:unnamed protein product [Paramecium sonneborni]|uniref:Phosphoglycerate mutase n=1 Tax=Paramecium sonneborni TaxID=65129 RepID=A0A8S1K1U0_9CILI|nr:unnamed protein product [Paramecium sonneborni]
MIQIGQKTIQIWLVRHGQTEGNKLQILQGQDDGQLSALGVKQAEALGKRIKKENFDIVFVSDLARTKQTFELIQKHHAKQMIPNYESLLREKHAGIYIRNIIGCFVGIKFNIAQKISCRIRSGYQIIQT